MRLEGRLRRREPPLAPRLETIASAQAQARRVVEEGAQRREDIEAVITDLVRRRDDVVLDAEALAAKLTGAVEQHRPSGPDPFAAPEEFDPLEREGEETETDDLDDEDDEPEDEDEGTDEPEPSGRIQA
jgi:hypothetical protein